MQHVSIVFMSVWLNLLMNTTKATPIRFLFLMFCLHPTSFCSLLTLGAHAQEDTVLVSSVCMSVCYHLVISVIRFYGLSKVHVHTAVFWLFNVWIFEKKPSVQKVWRFNNQFANEHLPFATGFSPFQVPCIRQ